MTANPEMVAGAGRFDTDVMTTASARILSKSGAEGIHGIAVPDRHFGLAVQVDDGSDRGYRQLVIALLLRHGVLTQEEADWIDRYHELVFRELSPRLQEPDVEWLRQATRPLKEMTGSEYCAEVG